jgi:hypothetical protein
MKNDGQDAPAVLAGFTLDGVECWPSLDDLGTWLYVPGPIGPERNVETGVPTLSVLSVAGSGILQCGAQWAADPQTLERLRLSAAERAGLPQVRLSPAPARIKAAQLELIGRDGATALLQETTTSNFTPYTALFHVTVDADKMSRVKEALAGSAGILSISYIIVVERRARAIARVTGSPQVPLTDSDQSPQRLLELIRAALAAGQLKLDEGAEGPVQEELRAQARNAALDRAAAMLQTTSPQPRGDVRSGVVSIDATVSLAGVTEVEISRTTDIAKWWQHGGAPEVFEEGTTAPAPSAQTTAADGSITEHPPKPSQETNIRL